MNGVLYTYPDVTGDYIAFTQAYRAKYNSDPQGPSAANAYDAVRVIIAALMDHYKNGTNIETAVAKTNIPGTAVKEIRFNKNHQLDTSNFQIKTVRDGQFVVVQ